MLSVLPNLPRPVVKTVVGLWRRRWLIAGVAWATAVAGWLATLILPDMYESRAQIYINTDTALDPALADVSVRPNLEKSVRIIRTQLLSRDNIEQVIYETGRDAGIDGPIELERAIRRLQEKIAVESEEEQYFVITYADRDPAQAQRVVEAVLDLFVEQNVGTAIADVDRALGNLNREIEERLSRLEAIDQRIAAFRQANAPELAGTERLAQRLEAKDDEYARLQDQIAAVTMRRERLLGQLSTTPRYAPGSDLDALKLQLATLKSQFNDNYPDIRRLEAQITALESGEAILPENRDYVALQANLRAANDELTTLRSRAVRVQAEIDQLSLDVAQTPAAESELIGLMREREQIERTYSQLAEERAAMDVFANLNQAGGAMEYRRFEAPTVAAEPSWPPRGLMMLAILIVAFGSGLGMAFLFTQLDRTYTQAADLETALGLPVLGAVSPVPTPARRARTLTERAGLVMVLGGLVIAMGAMFWWYDIRVGDDADARPLRQAQLIGGIR